MTMTELCTELKNWFERSTRSGEFEIKDGVLDVDFLLDGQYFRIIGSVFNDGVHQFPAKDLKNEVFSGEIVGMAVPPDVISLLTDINEWSEQNSAVMNSPYSSESFGGYSYTLASDQSGGGASSAGITWQAKFRTRLNKWRKV